MKQDLKRQDLQTVFLGNASTPTISSAAPDRVDAASGDVSGNKWYQKDDVKELLKHPKMYEKSTFYEILELLFGRGIVTRSYDSLSTLERTTQGRANNLSVVPIQAACSFRKS
ncbi:hypothetical protein TNCT_633771 [Trichonephila clavata]|uniref:Uncharacterized protein n=1 Tax=Trichonephila clavata TaxID=2740835 RepID=A0A8X6KZK9_TRICU|nr:hypothetical protein TNCT_633771 [Trichonephila clavata]